MTVSNYQRTAVLIHAVYTQIYIVSIGVFAPEAASFRDNKGVSLMTKLVAVSLIILASVSGFPVQAAESSSTLPSQVGIDQAAPIISRQQIFISAPASVVWDLHVNFASWPDWQPDMEYMRAPKFVVPGENFYWRTEGLAEITSTIQQVEPRERIVWGGNAQGITAVHAWIIEPAAGGVTLRTEESWNGIGLAEQAEALQPLLDASLERWLAAIKQEAESTTK